MAYPISSTALGLFQTPYRQVVSITFEGTEESLEITESNIPTGGMTVNRYCVSGSRIEIGSVIASELTLVLDNSDGKYDDVVFEGAELFVRVGVKKWDAKTWENAAFHFVPFGYFTVDETPRKLRSITLSALDRMMLFDKKVDNSLLSFPMTVDTLLGRICDICNVVCDTNLALFPNHDYVVEALPPDEDLTYRQYLSWIAEITGTCGFMDWNGHLVLKWYEPTDTVLTMKERHDSDLKENAVTLTGVQVVDTDGEVYLVGDDGYAINIESNSLIQNNYREVAEALYDVLNDFTYTPFTATVKPMPQLYPLDMITFVDKKGVKHPTIITDFTFTLNKSTVLQGKGETATKSGYASSNPLTKRESAIINSIKHGQNTAMNDRIQTILAFNELISNALGLYVTPMVQLDGSTIYYIHNLPKLEESSTIFTMTANGIAWTTSGWNDGEPVWSYGVTSAGDALFRMLSAEGIEVSKVGEDYNIEVTPRAFKIYYRDMLVTNIETDEMTIPKAVFTSYAQSGKIRWVPYTRDSQLVGTNLVFID